MEAAWGRDQPEPGLIQTAPALALPARGSEGCLAYLTAAAKPITAGRNTTAIEARADWLTEDACSPCPAFAAGWAQYPAPKFDRGTVASTCCW
jgi:hypothetical protein